LIYINKPPCTSYDRKEPVKAAKPSDSEDDFDAVDDEVLIKSNKWQKSQVSGISGLVPPFTCHAVLT
jgi:hypothetical protein